VYDVAEEGVTMRAIAETIGVGAQRPFRSLTENEARAHFDWMACIKHYSASQDRCCVHYQRVCWPASCTCRPLHMALQIEGRPRLIVVVEPSVEVQQVQDNGQAVVDRFHPLVCFGGDDRGSIKRRV
jgi:hypothetical protein